MTRGPRRRVALQKMSKRSGSLCKTRATVKVRRFGVLPVGSALTQRETLGVRSTRRTAPGQAVLGIDRILAASFRRLGGPFLFLKFKGGSEWCIGFSCSGMALRLETCPKADAQAQEAPA